MDLQTIVENTPRILAETAVSTATFYPIYSGVKSMMGKEKFTEVLTEAETFRMTALMGVSLFFFKYGCLFFK